MRKSLVSRLTGGRPMEPVRLAFEDVVTGRNVWYRRDQFGRLWMAHGRWSVFRVRVPRDELPEDRSFETMADYSQSDTEEGDLR